MKTGMIGIGAVGEGPEPRDGRDHRAERGYRYAGLVGWAFDGVLPRFVAARPQLLACLRVLEASGAFVCLRFTARPAGRDGSQGTSARQG